MNKNFSHLFLGIVLLVLVWLNAALGEDSAFAALSPRLSNTDLVSPEISSSLSFTQRKPIAPPANEALAPPDIQRILNRGKLVVSMSSKDNPPFFMVNSAGVLDGLDVHLAKMIAELLGVTVEFNRSAKTFDDVVKMVYEQKTDLAFSKLSRTLKRAKSVSFSSPYVELREGLLINRLKLARLTTDKKSQADVIRTLSAKIGILRGSSYKDFAGKRFPKAEVVEFSSWSDIVKAVIKGDILAAYRDELEIKKIVLNQPQISLTLQTAVITDTKDYIAVALPWNSQQLREFVNQAFNTLGIRYTADSLLKEYSN